LIDNILEKDLLAANPKYHRNSCNYWLILSKPDFREMELDILRCGSPNWDPHDRLWVL